MDSNVKLLSDECYNEDLTVFLGWIPVALKPMRYSQSVIEET
ncbi:MAG TPA: hypothetical protein V6D11_08165 [Waterburya sp.]